MTDLCYAPGGVLDCKDVSPIVSLRLAELDVVSRSASRLEAEVLATPGVYETHPVRYVGSPIDQWQEETGRVEDGVQPDDWWQTTISYADMSYADAKQQARGILHQYLWAYRSSEFTAAGFVFLADAERSTVYNTLATFADTLVKRGEQADIDFWILDKDETEHHFTTEAEVLDFLRKWCNLWLEAQNTTLTAWQAIRDATAPNQTADYVRGIINGLPPVPGTV